MNALERRRQTAMEKLMAIGTARRGQLSEQYYQYADQNGKVCRSGPYFVWQRWHRGKKQSVRVPSSAFTRVRADLERGREVDEIFHELWLIMEQKAMSQDTDSKKKSKQFKRHSGGKSRNS